MKSHYHSEFHRVNSKRRAAELPPLTLVTFEALVAKKEESKKQAEEEAAECIYICDACHKKFSNENQFKTHNSSSKHRERVKELIAERKAAAVAAAEAAKRATEVGARISASGGATDSKGEDSGTAGGGGGAGGAGAGAAAAADGDGEAAEEIIISSSHCVFCWKDSGSVDGNYAHMRGVHSFVVPDEAAVADREGLVEYLHAKVIEGCVCIYCDSRKVYDSPQATQQHMADKGHCRMRYEEEGDFEEFQDFYDYSLLSDSDDDDEEEDEAVGERDEDGRLVLKSGATAAHRNMMRYLNQRYSLPDTRVSVQAALRNSSWASRAGAAATGGAPGAGLNGKGYGSGALVVAAARGFGVGTRGNDTDIKGQRQAADYLRRKELHTGMQMNQIRRRYFRIQLLQ